MIRVLIVDDSKTMQRIMQRALGADPAFNVVAFAEDGQSAVRMAKTYSPDLITMDILMPRMNGLDATRQIMEEDPRPIVMVSAIGDAEEQGISFEAMEAGAVWVIRKPKGDVTADWDRWSESLCSILKSMAEVSVVKRHRKREPISKSILNVKPASRPEVIAIAASTGGPTALMSIFKDLPEDYPIPILVCQHITQGFVSGLAQWLGESLALPVRVAGDSSLLSPGITVSPDTGHLEVFAKDRLVIRPDNSGSGHVPSANRLFSSVAVHYKSNAIGIIMTGMGKDGVEGMGALWKQGALTICQDESSSLIYGMPKVAKENGYIHHEMNLEQIREALGKFPKKEN